MPLVSHDVVRVILDGVERLIFSPANSPPGIWRTKEGIVMSISEMTESHLINAIHYLDKQVATIQAKRAELEAEANKRGLSVPNIGDNSPLPAATCQEEVDIIADLEERSKL